MRYSVRMAGAPEPLFTPRFFLMCGFSFTVFLSAFQLFPTAPFHILRIGGSTFSAGLFLGLLTYSSAFSAPLTGALGDRLGRRRTLVVFPWLFLANLAPLPCFRRRTRDRERWQQREGNPIRDAGDHVTLIHERPDWVEAKPGRRQSNAPRA